MKQDERAKALKSRLRAIPVSDLRRLGRKPLAWHREPFKEATETLRQKWEAVLGPFTVHDFDSEGRRRHDREDTILALVLLDMEAYRLEWFAPKGQWRVVVGGVPRKKLPPVDSR